jgi:hypothetical protein
VIRRGPHLSAGLGGRSIGQRSVRVRFAAALLAAIVPFLAGCAGVLVASSVATMGAALPSKEPHWVETNELAFAYPIDDVYTSLAQNVARNGRAIVASNAESRSLVVSYPFSWLKNNWGGSLRITCVPSEFGTTVIIVGDGRDAVARVRKIGDEVLEDLDATLRRLPRTL